MVNQVEKVRLEEVATANAKIREGLSATRNGVVVGGKKNAHWRVIFFPRLVEMQVSQDLGGTFIRFQGDSIRIEEEES